MSAPRTCLAKAMRHSSRRVRSSTTLQVSSGSPSLASSNKRRYSSLADGDQHNEPTGLIFGELPRKDGGKRAREDWELIWHIGMGGSMLFAVGIFWFRPDTSISTWALEEAKARLEARGDAAKYIPSAESRIQHPTPA